jgi:hypothetical protein
MAEKTSNTPTSQQVNDAQHLDSMTSLQQPNTVEQSFLMQGLNYPNLDSSFQNLEFTLTLFNVDIVAWTVISEESLPKGRFMALWL